MQQFLQELFLLCKMKKVPDGSSHISYTANPYIQNIFFELGRRLVFSNELVRRLVFSKQYHLCTISNFEDQLPKNVLIHSFITKRKQRRSKWNNGAKLSLTQSVLFMWFSIKDSNIKDGTNTREKYIAKQFIITMWFICKKLVSCHPRI